jgi:NADH-quinone oxidoreductase subunit N
VDISAPAVDLGAVAPLIVVLAGAAIVLMLDLVVAPAQRAVLAYVSLAITAIAFVACVPLWNNSRFAYADMVHVDRFGLFFSVVVLGAVALTILLSIDYLRQQEMNYGEYYPLLLFTAAGMLAMAISNDLVMIFISLEILSIGLYILSGFARGNQRSEESALKYFLLGSFSLAFLVYGTALIYGATGTTNFTAIAQALGDDNVRTNPLLLAGVGLILVGFGFKLALVPFHMWTPDVYCGAPTSVTAFMSVATKVAVFAALVRTIIGAMPALRDGWITPLWGLAIVTMIVGNIAAVMQRDIKRMLAYSSIGQAGYVLVAVVAAESVRQDVSDAAVSSILYYLLAYTVMNLGAFAVVIALAQRGSERLDLNRDYAGLARTHPWLAGALAVFMLSLAGIPPTSGFIGKMAVFRAAINAGYWPLALIGVITSVIALAFYLRVIVLMYTRDPQEQADGIIARTAAPVSVVLTVCVVLTLFFGILPGLPFDIAQRALFVIGQ